tara:strand:+ start:1566 stop:1961 length:396 start_codon:yes stop_codon:yes gene_type:complete
MRLFKNFEPGANQMDRPNRQTKSTKKEKSARTPKESLSAAEIKNKVQEHFKPKPEVDKVELSKFSKIKNETEHDKEKEVEEKEVKVPSDVGLNDPNDPATVGKLKDVLTKGAFNFNPKERETLEKILAERG